MTKSESVKAFIQRVGDGESPAENDSILLPSEPEVPKVNT